MDLDQAVETLRAENDELEKAIEALTSQGSGETKMLNTLGSSERKGGFKVMQFGPTSITGEAGVDKGSSYRPQQTKPRTQLGGFFTS